MKNLKIFFPLLFAMLLFVGCSDREYDNKTQQTGWTVYSESNSWLPRNGVSCIAIDNNNNKWIGTAWYGLSMFDGTNWTVYNPSNSGLSSNSINCIAIDHNNNKWIGTRYGGLCMFDGNDNWIVYNTSNIGLYSYNIRCIAIDHNNNKWIGTAGGLWAGGLAVLKGQ